MSSFTTYSSLRDTFPSHSPMNLALGDAEYGSFVALGYYIKEMKIKYYLKHEDSMEVQLVELVHASTKKMRDMKWSYGKRIQQLSLELKHLNNIILYEQKHTEHHIDPLEFEAHKQEWE